MKRLTANLAPADLRKAGPAYDPPTTIELLLATKQGCGDDGRAVYRRGALRNTDGVLPMVSMTRNQGPSAFGNMERNLL